MVSGKDYIGTSIVSGSVHGCVCARLVRLFMTPFTIARQAPLSMEFPSSRTGAGCHFLLQGIFPPQGWNAHLLPWQVDSSLLWPWEALFPAGGGHVWTGP